MSIFDPPLNFFAYYFIIAGCVYFTAELGFILKDLLKGDA
jgi:hypothetical protein